MLKILVSFKAKEKDLFELVSSQGDKSNYIKDALKYSLERRGEKVKTPDISEVKGSEIMNNLESV